MKKVMALITVAVFILFTGCSSSKSMTSSQTASLMSNSGAESSEAQTSQVSASLSSSGNSSTQGINQAPDAQVNVKNEGNQIATYYNSNSQVAECLMPYHIDLSIANISSNPISKAIIRANNLDGCAQCTEGLNDTDLPVNKNYAGYEWDYTGTISPNHEVSCELAVIPKQLKDQTITFKFYMADGKTPFKDGSGKNAQVVANFKVNGSDADNIKATVSCDIGSYLIKDFRSAYQLIFNISNESGSVIINGLELQIKKSCFKNFKIQSYSTGWTLKETSENYIWDYKTPLPCYADNSFSLILECQTESRSYLEGPVEVDFFQLSPILKLGAINANVSS